MKKVFVLLLALMMVFMSSASVFAFPDNEADDLKEAAQLVSDADKALEKSNYTDAGDYYYWAAARYEFYKKYAEAYLYYDKAGKAYEQANEMDDAETCFNKRDQYVEYANTASIFSGGSLTIVVGLASAVIFGLLGFLLGRKRRPAEL